MQPQQEEGKVGIQTVEKAVVEIINNVTESEGEQARLRSQAIDFLCIGRAGVGKTSFLEALTGRNLGSTGSLDHGTQTLTCYHVRDELPTEDGGKLVVNLRFWDTRGIDQWSEHGDVDQLQKDIEANKIRPLCVFYCATGNGRVDSTTVGKIINTWFKAKVPIFYLITNIYSLDDDGFEGQRRGAKEILYSITLNPPTKLDENDLVYRFGHHPVFIVGVNSKPFSSRFIKKEVENIDTVMRLCVETLDHEQITQFFLATLHNRRFWNTAYDSVFTYAARAKAQLVAIGVQIQGYLQALWAR